MFWVLLSVLASSIWLLYLFPQYVGLQLWPYLWWLFGSLVWLLILLSSTQDSHVSGTVLAGFGVAATSLGALGAVDLATHRLPRQISYTSLVLVVVLFSLSSLSEPARLTNLFIGILLMALMIALLRLISGRSLGKGDVHLAPLLGALIGWFDPRAVVVACLAMSLSAGSVAGILIATRRRRKSDVIAYGPYMLLGAAVAILRVGGRA